MPQNKTQPTKISIEDFLQSFVESENKRAESRQLITLMQQWSGYPPVMWGPSIIGFGSCHYRYASGREGDMPLIAFSPRKAAFSLYVYSMDPAHEPLVKALGKFTMGKSCIYVKKLADIDLKALEKLCKATMDWAEKKYKAR